MSRMRAVDEREFASGGQGYSVGRLHRRHNRYRRGVLRTRIGARIAHKSRVRVFSRRNRGRASVCVARIVFGGLLRAAVFRACGIVS